VIAGLVEWQTTAGAPGKTVNPVAATDSRPGASQATNLRGWPISSPDESVLVAARESYRFGSWTEGSVKLPDALEENIATVRAVHEEASASDAGGRQR
jgi:hypothetical protein